MRKAAKKMQEDLILTRILSGEMFASRNNSLHQRPPGALSVLGNFLTPTGFRRPASQI
jgi:hypothetical protein